MTVSRGSSDARYVGSMSNRWSRAVCSAAARDWPTSSGTVTDAPTFGRASTNAAAAISTVITAPSRNGAADRVRWGDRPTGA